MTHATKKPVGNDAAGSAVPRTPWVLRSRANLFAVAVAVLVLLLGLPAWLITTQVQQSLYTEAVNESARTAHLAARMVDAHLDGLRRYVETYGRRQRLLEAVARRDLPNLRANLEEMVRANPHVDRVFVTDARGTLWADFPPAPTVLGKNFAARDWFRGVSARQASYISGIYQRAAPPQTHLLAIAVPLRDRTGATIAYLVGQHAVEALVQWLGQLERAGTVRLSLTDQYGVLAATTDGEAALVSLAEHPSAARALRGEAGAGEVADPVTGEPALVSYAPVVTTGWTVLAHEPLALVAEPIVALRSTVIGMTVAFFLVAAGFGFVALNTVQSLNTGLARRAADLEAANHQLEAFSYSVSHDLRAPLRAIDGFSQALVEDHGPKLDLEARDHLARVRAAAQRMGHLIDDLLRLSRVSRAELNEAEVDLSRLARETAADVARREPARAVDLVIAPNLRARGDPDLLRVVFDNLLSNAWKFTGRQAQARVEVGASEANGRRAYFVRDNGAGFDMAYVNKLFGAFQRLHDAHEFPGTGVGLATVQRIIHKHGGKVWAEGEPGRGAAFYFTLSKEAHGE